MNEKSQYVAFEGGRKIASGELRDVALKAHKAIQACETAILIFNDASSEVIELDLRGSSRDVLRKLEETPIQAVEPEAPRKPGRPKLGVVAREVTLLPRHWDWLNVQPGGASVAIRKLVEEARRVHRNTDRVRKAKESAYRFMSTMAGNEPGFEEATRGLFAGDAIRFAEYSRQWPSDVRAHAARLAARAFEGGATNE